MKNEKLQVDEILLKWASDWPALGGRIWKKLSKEPGFPETALVRFSQEMTVSFFSPIIESLTMIEKRIAALEKARSGSRHKKASLKPAANA